MTNEKWLWGHLALLSYWAWFSKCVILLKSNQVKTDQPDEGDEKNKICTIKHHVRQSLTSALHAPSNFTYQPGHGVTGSHISVRLLAKSFSSSSLVYSVKVCCLSSVDLLTAQTNPTQLPSKQWYAFTQVLYLSTNLRYFPWVFPFYVTSQQYIK